MSKKLDFSRRKFLTATGIAAGAAALGGAMLTAEVQAAAPAAHAASEHSANNGSKMYRGMKFFTNDLQLHTIEEAAERIFPKDDLGPGAKELMVAFFIDNQLASGYGYNSREYTSGPYFEGAPTQGYQTALLRKDVFLQGINALNDTANKMYKNNFPDLSDANKDIILQMCMEGKIATEGFTSTYFFNTLKELVIAGVYSDPIYSGNNNMAGWKMKKYPGAQMSYYAVINKPGFQEIAPMSLADMEH